MTMREIFKQSMKIFDWLLCERTLKKNVEDMLRIIFVYISKISENTAEYSENDMPMLIENITGRKVMYNVVPDDTVEKVKDLISVTENLPVRQQILIFGQTILENNAKLSSYGINQDSTIKLLVLPRSGPIGEGRDFAVNRCTEKSFDASEKIVREAPSYSVEDLTHIFVTCLLKKTDESHLISNTGSINGTHNIKDFDEALPSTSTFVSHSSDLASNLRTMQRLKDLRRSMERLDQLRAKKKQFYEQDTAQVQMRAENANGHSKSSRQRRTSGCSAGSRSFSSRYVNCLQQKDHLISADDTSAKESSAGETEFDDYAVVHCPHSMGGNAFDKYFACRTYLTVKSSSCSDLDRNNDCLDPEQAKLLLKSDSDQEYLTTTEYFNVSDPNLFRNEFKSVPKISIKRGGSSEENDQNYSEDPASSGAVIYDHIFSARRFKIKKKNTGIRQHCALKNRHLAIDDSTDDLRRRNPKSFQIARGTHVFRPAGVNVPAIQRRTRSKSRLLVQQLEKVAPIHTKNTCTTTGDETSSDECAKQHASKLSDSLPANKIAKPNVLSKAKFPNFRAASAQKKAWISSGAPPEKGVSPSTSSASAQQHFVLEPTDEFAASSSYALPRHHKLPQSSHAQQRCNVCSCRLTQATTFHCRCGKTTCPRHRNADLHACGYDFRRSAAVAAAIIASIDATNNGQNVASTSSSSQNDRRTRNLGGEERTRFQ